MGPLCVLATRGDVDEISDIEKKKNDGGPPEKKKLFGRYSSRRGLTDIGDGRWGKATAGTVPLPVCQYKNAY